MNLRARARDDSRILNIRDWSGLILLTDPDGVVYNTDAKTGEKLKYLQCLNDKVSFTPDAGEDMAVSRSVVTISRDSLDRIPQAGETWFIQVQIEPDGPLVSKVITSDRAPEGGESLGFIRLYMQDVDQAI